MCVAAMTNYGIRINIVCLLLINKEKEIQVYISIYSTKQVLTILNGCLHHLIIIYLRIKFQNPVPSGSNSTLKNER